MDELDPAMTQNFMSMDVMTPAGILLPHTTIETNNATSKRMPMDDNNPASPGSKGPTSPLMSPLRGMPFSGFGKSAQAPAANDTRVEAERKEGETEKPAMLRRRSSLKEYMSSVAKQVDSGEYPMAGE